MRIGLLVLGLCNGLAATFLAVHFGAGPGVAALHYATASTLSVLGGAVIWTNRARLIRMHPRAGAPPRQPPATHPGRAPPQAPDRDWSAAA